ncbi:hypothetical protein JHS3_25180 [Jeongeupia sp. HS-3]|uniref:hypothetical protein n=1 Tax=Jeongeupia sp. HS-3 TaxID=1009682 RepID=UPI0018A685CB|nr:hypothetical protein [Jeongeupia sp. HS-3]BCL76782.1 hypothetical protein JHS3_25180 [Jeongeupia sp. HS-3]
MSLESCVQQLPPDTARRVLATLLGKFVDPAFGALPKLEIELLVLDALIETGFIGREPDVYGLVSGLRITRSKARNLLYSRELRHSSLADLDRKAKALLKRPLIQKNGEQFLLEIDNPLLADHLRARVQKRGFVSDGSFSPNIVRLGLDALSALIEDYLSDDEKEAVRRVLVEAGAPDTSFAGVLKATLKKIAGKVAEDTGEALMDKASEYLGPIIDAGIDRLRERALQLFDEVHD